jgi:hypothetical protein
MMVGDSGDCGEIVGKELVVCAIVGKYYHREINDVGINATW